MTYIQPTKSVKEEYGSGSDGTPEQALKYAQDTPGQALEAKRLLKLIRNKKMSKTLQIIKKVVEEQRQTPSYDGPLIPDIRREKHWV